MPVLPLPVASDTRQRLIGAAGEVFAAQGFHAATVRQITEKADVNVAAINYYFRDKNELYAACLREAKCTAIEAAGEWRCTSRAPEDRLRHFIDRMVRRLLNPNRPKWHHDLINRELLQPTGALDQLVEEGIRPDCVELEAIIAELTGGAFTRERMFLIGCSVVAQCLFHLQNRPIIDRLNPKPGSEPPSLEALVEHILEFSLAAIRTIASHAQ